MMKDLVYQFLQFHSARPFYFNGSTSNSNSCTANDRNRRVQMYPECTWVDNISDGNVEAAQVSREEVDVSHLTSDSQVQVEWLRRGGRGWSLHWLMGCLLFLRGMFLVLSALVLPGKCVKIRIGALRTLYNSLRIP